jgi:hypothetical protein
MLSEFGSALGSESESDDSPSTGQHDTVAKVDRTYIGTKQRRKEAQKFAARLHALVRHGIVLLGYLLLVFAHSC